MKLRDYQREALNATYDGWREGRFENPLIVAPTGSGKSAIIAGFVKEAMTAFPGTRIIMATHVKELVEQNGARLKDMWPQAPIGYYSAGMKKRDKHSPILFGSVQSMVGKEYEIQACDVLVIDEAHLLSRDDSSSYRKFITAMRKFNADMRILGLTATPYRMDSGELHEGDGALFDGIAYEITIRTLLDRGYLCPVVMRDTSSQYDLNGVSKTRNDYNQKQLAQHVNKSDINESIVAEAMEIGHDRGHWLVFAVGIDHAERLRDILNREGVATATISGKTPLVERSKILQDFRQGKLRAITSADALTTGIDLPLTDYLVMARATTSPGLFVQMVGRGMRPSDGKQNCLMADFGGNAHRHGPIDAIVPPGQRRKGEGSAPLKTCPQCMLIIPAQQIKCSCGYEWPRDYYKKLEAKAAAAKFINAVDEPFWSEVKSVQYDTVVTANGNRKMLRVSYSLGQGRVATELVPVEHTNQHFVVEAWWRHRAPNTLVPGTVAAALHLCDQLRRPGAVKIVRRGKYFNVVDHAFEG